MAREPRVAAEHVGDVGLGCASDQEIWNYARASNCIIVSKDEDFAQRKILNLQGPAVVWVRLSNARRRDLLVWFEHILPALLQALERGETFIELV